MKYVHGSGSGTPPKQYTCCRYVIQRYITRPLLWEGKFKFHFRVYIVLTANMQFHVYRRAFAHVANKPFAMPTATKSAASPADSAIEWDPDIHIVNVAGANVHAWRSLLWNSFVVDLPKSYPNFWSQIKKLFSSLASMIL